MMRQPARNGWWSALLNILTIAALLLLTACAPRNAASFLPEGLKAELKMEQQQQLQTGDSSKSIEDILRDAAGQEANVAVAQSTIEKTPAGEIQTAAANDGVDTTATGSIIAMPAIRPSTFRQRGENGFLPAYRDVATDGLPTNAAIAKNWVDTGPEDLEGLPIEGFDEEVAHHSEDADSLFASYMSSNEIGSEPLDDLQLANASTANEPTADSSLLTAEELLAKSQELSRSKARTPQNNIIARAKALLDGNSAKQENKKSNKPLKEIVLRFSPDQNAPSSADLARLKALQFTGQKPKLVRAGLGSDGTAFEQLQTAQQRMAAVSTTLNMKDATTHKIDPSLPDNTITIVLGN